MSKLFIYIPDSDFQARYLVSGGNQLIIKQEMIYYNK